VEGRSVARKASARREEVGFMVWVGTGLRRRRVAGQFKSRPLGFTA